ncbi:MAG: hypothetical protein HZB26_21315 [Candidatus Hydrogenedentes bacterium]|nr:hypothetical protein [Candidatus Hydrogenedentota bacterium]
MHQPTRTRVARWILAIGIWLALSVSLGWYYTFTYYGRAGWPMPLIEPCLALVMYYFSVLNVATEIQALHWVLVFPIAGVAWAFTLWLLAAHLGARQYALDKTVLAIALTCLPLIAPLPYMSLVAGQTSAGFDGHRMLSVALRHAWVEPWPWLTPMYFTLGMIAMGLQLAVYRRAFSARGRRAWLHFLASAIAATMVVCVTASLVAIPLRQWFE